MLFRSDAVLQQLRELEKTVPYPMTDFHTDNGGEFLNCARTASALLFQTARFSVHPLQSSVNVRELT